MSSRITREINSRERRRRQGERRPWVHLMRAQSMMHLYAVDSCDSCNVAVNHGRWAKKNPGPDHIARMAAPILERVAESCDGSERRWVDPPGKIYAEELEWQAKFRELDIRWEQLMRRGCVVEEAA